MNTLLNTFEQVRVGYNMALSNINCDEENKKVYRIIESKNITNTVIQEKLEERSFNNNIKDDCLLRKNDIIVSTRKPFTVGLYRESGLSDIIASSNFIILRGLNITKYDPVFLANYLNKNLPIIFKNESTISKTSLIEDVKLPNVDLLEQKKYKDIFDLINRRDSIITNILEQDNLIINSILNKLGGTNE